jgi:hypothetical protein
MYFKSDFFTFKTQIQRIFTNINENFFKIEMWHKISEICYLNFTLVKRVNPFFKFYFKTY